LKTRNTCASTISSRYIGACTTKGATSKRIPEFRVSWAQQQLLIVFEKPNPGLFPATIPGVDESDAFLALCQRWAMQYLSACRFAHGAGVIIAASPDYIS
jgi:hypothetical protein